jgi:hypothetical protein
MRGAFPDVAPRSIPRDGAALLRNLRLHGGLARSREGSSNLHLPFPNLNRIYDTFNLIFNNATVRVLRCTDATGTSGGTSALHYDTGSAWDDVILDNAFTTVPGDRYWAVVAPWGASAVGRIIISNGRKIKQWDGDPAATMADVVSGVPGRIGFMGPDNRLFVGNIVDTGETRLQEIAFTIPNLTGGAGTDWTGTGSGRLRLRNDSWPISGGWVQYGRIFISKTRSIVALDPTGLVTDPYGFSPIITNGRGVYASRSLVQWGEAVSFLSADGFAAFDGTNVPEIVGPSRSLLRRLNTNALENISSVYLEDDRIILWALPLDGATDPNEVWAFDVKTGGWSVDTAALPRTSLSLYMNVDITYIAELVGNINVLAGFIAGLSGSISPKATVLYGSTFGVVTKSNPAASVDFFVSGYVSEYVSPALKPVGEEVGVAGQRHTITEDDYLILDQVRLTLLDLGSTYTLAVDTSGDGGRVWKEMGQVTMTTNAGTDLAPKMVEKRLAQRTSLGAQCQIRLRNITTGVPWGWEEIRVSLDVLGQQK